ncbi:putative D,D-dipeptide-binding periplasmic protein DdpA precursor [mine drainage metagenome]|uniref:Putative D,D-dipeptide-binding periplasmic protein DdpA n=1 Tax=mine drainage metagenome TaxID=410659 RepID=A0A1J5QA57_9ZZZZ
MKSLPRLRFMAVAALTAIVGSLLVSAPSQAAAALSTKPVVIARTADIDKLDPHLATAFQTFQTLGLVYGTLVELKTDLSIAPGLATSWKFDDGAKTLTFKLRKNVTFQNGAKFTSADVKATFNRILDQNTAAVARSNFTSISRIITPDPFTVIFVLTDPAVPMLAALTDVNASILSAADIKAKTVGKKPNGTGPFMWSSWKVGQSITLKAFPKYWGGKPKISGVTFRVIPTETSALAAVKAKSATMALISDPIVAKQAGSSVATYRVGSLAYHALMLNARSPQLQDLNVRLAIQCAVDRQGVLNTAALGEGSVTGPITSPAYKSNPNARPCPKRDLAKAKAYMAASGKTNIKLTTIVSQGEYATALAEAQTLQSQLKDIGINLDLQVTDIATYVNRWLAADFDAAIALNGGRVDPDTMYKRYFTSTGNLNKIAGYSSPTLDALFEKGRSTDNVKARKAIYNQVSAELENNAVWIWMFTAYDYSVATKKLKGYAPMANGSLQNLRVASLLN